MQMTSRDVIVFDTETTGLWNEPTRMVCPYDEWWVKNKTKGLLEERYGAKEPSIAEDPNAWLDWQQFRGENLFELTEIAVDLYLAKYAGKTRDDLQPNPFTNDPWKRQTEFKSAEILTLSIIDGDGNVLLDEMYKPAHTDSWPGAQAINNISPEMVADKGPILADREKIETIFRDAKVILGYNGVFDIKALRNSGLSIPYIAYKQGSQEPAQYQRYQQRQLVDVMHEFAHAWGEYRPNKQEPTWKKLTFAAEKMGLEWDGEAHGSLADAKMTFAVHNALEAGWTRDQAVRDVSEQATKSIDHAMSTDAVELPSVSREQQVEKPSRGFISI